MSTTPPPRSRQEERKTPPSPPRKKSRSEREPLADDDDYTLAAVQDVGVPEASEAAWWLIPNSAITADQRREVLEKFAVNRVWSVTEVSRLRNLLDEKRASNALEEQEHARWDIAADGPLDHRDLRRLARPVRHVYLVRYGD